MMLKDLAYYKQDEIKLSTGDKLKSAFLKDCTIVLSGKPIVENVYFLRCNFIRAKDYDSTGTKNCIVDFDSTKPEKSNE